MLPIIIVNFLPGMPVPPELLVEGPSACVLHRDLGLVAVVPTDHFLPVDFDAFHSQPCTLSIAPIHRFAVGLEFRFDRNPAVDGTEEAEPLTLLYAHSAVVHRHMTRSRHNRDGEDMSLFMKDGLMVHLIAYDSATETIVTVRRGELEKPLAWRWRFMAERQLKAARRFQADRFHFEVADALNTLPSPLPGDMVKARQILPPPCKAEMPLCVLDCEDSNTVTSQEPRAA